MPAFGYRELPFAILNGASLSAALQINGLHGEAIYMPAAWTAAGLSFAGCDTQGGTYLPLVDALGVEVTLTVAAGTLIVLPISLIRGMNWLKLRSGTSGAAVNQGADRSILLHARAYG